MIFLEIKLECGGFDIPLSFASRVFISECQIEAALGIAVLLMPFDPDIRKTVRRKMTRVSESGH